MTKTRFSATLYKLFDRISCFHGESDRFYLPCRKQATRIIIRNYGDAPLALFGIRKILPPHRVVELHRERDGAWVNFKDRNMRFILNGAGDPVVTPLSVLEAVANRRPDVQ